MKQILLVFTLSLLLFNCNELDKLTVFDLAYTESVTIQSGANVNLPFDISTPDVSANSNSSFASNNTNKDLVEDIRLKQLILTITAPSSGEFSFLKSITLYISADGLPETKIAGKTNIPDNQGNTLTLDVEDVDLREYIKKDTYKLRLNTVTDKLITEDQEVEVYSQFKVNAKILGV